jgi:hypothetical protein
MMELVAVMMRRAMATVMGRLARAFPRIDGYAEVRGQIRIGRKPRRARRPRAAP